MFIRVMKSIDEEVVSREVQRSTVELAHNTEIVRNFPRFFPKNYIERLYERSWNQRSSASMV